MGRNPRFHRKNVFGIIVQAVEIGVGIVPGNGEVIEFQTGKFLLLPRSQRTGGEARVTAAVAGHPETAAMMRVESHIGGARHAEVRLAALVPDRSVVVGIVKFRLTVAIARAKHQHLAVVGIKRLDFRKSRVAEGVSR